MRPDDVDRPVSRAPVDHNIFDIVVMLSDNTFYGLLDEPLPIPDTGDDRNSGQR